jgi:hypothetical protein
MSRSCRDDRRLAGCSYFPAGGVNFMTIAAGLLSGGIATASTVARKQSAVAFDVRGSMTSIRSYFPRRS